MAPQEKQQKMSLSQANSTPAQAAEPTWLATHLAGNSEVVPYGGSMTPPRLDAPAAEMAALAHGCAVHDLGWRRRIAVKGSDAVRWLNGMVTNSVRDLEAGQSVWNLVLDAQGHILGELTVIHAATGLELVIEAAQYEKIFAHLDRFIIMDDVELTPVEGVTALGVAGPKAAETLAKLGIPAPEKPEQNTTAEWQGATLRVEREFEALVPHFTLCAEKAKAGKLWQALRETGAVAVGCEQLEALRIAEAIPAYGVDMVERDLPQESSQDRALHANKGCYIGQEIVERVRARGMVRRHLRALALSGPVPAAGTALLQEDGSSAGEITSAAALALAGGKRVVALARIPAAVEVRKPKILYQAGNQTGTARLLDAPESF